MQTGTDKKHFTVVVPVFNEAESLPTFVPTAIKFCREHGWDIIFVNDGSQDQTRNILTEYASIDLVHVLPAQRVG